jgi:hypothetical protein
VCLLRIESILESGEHVVKRFSGSVKEEKTHKKGTWFITSRRLIYLPSPEVEIDLKKTIVGGALFGGIGGTLGTKVDMPESFKDYRLDNLISIDVEQGNTLKAVFQISGLDDTRAILLEVKKPNNFKSQVEEAKRLFEEEKVEFQREKALLQEMMNDEEVKKLSSDVQELEKELKDVENKMKDLEFAYAIGRISKEAYLKKMEKEKISEKIDQKKSMLEAKQRELSKQKEKYLRNRT